MYEKLFKKMRQKQPIWHKIKPMKTKQTYISRLFGTSTSPEYN